MDEVGLELWWYRWKLCLPNGELNKRLKPRTVVKTKCLMLWWWIIYSHVPGPELTQCISFNNLRDEVNIIRLTLENDE